VYRQVLQYPLFDPTRGDGVGNIVILAHDGAPAAIEPRALAALPTHPLVEKTLRAALAAPFEFPRGTPAHLLTDDYNPMDVLDLWLKERLRQHILETTPHRVL